LGDLAVDAGQVERHAHGEVAALEGTQGFEELAAVEHHVEAGLDRFHVNSSEEKGKSSRIVGAIPTAGYPNTLADFVVISTTQKNQKKIGVRARILDARSRRVIALRRAAALT